MEPQPIPTSSITDGDETFTPDLFDQWLDGEIPMSDLPTDLRSRAQRFLDS